MGCGRPYRYRRGLPLRYQAEMATEEDALSVNSVVNSAARRATHALLGSRRWIRRELLAVASNLAPGSALEIGSGKPHNGTYPYSQLDVLPPGWRLVHSDANASFGHRG